MHLTKKQVVFLQAQGTSAFKREGLRGHGLVQASFPQPFWIKFRKLHIVCLFAIVLYVVQVLNNIKRLPGH